MNTKYQSRTVWLQDGWARSDKMLRRVYNEFGPKIVSNKRFRVFPSSQFAGMTRKQVDAKWDFPARHLMHQIAKTLEHD